MGAAGPQPPPGLSVMTTQGRRPGWWWRPGARPGEQTCWEEAGPPLCPLHAEPRTCSATRARFAQTAVGPYLSSLSSSSSADSRRLTKELVSFQRTPHFPHSPLIHSLTAGLFTHIWPPVVTSEAVDMCPCLTPITDLHTLESGCPPRWRHRDS